MLIFQILLSLLIHGQIGRGMRLSAESGKKDCLIVDFVESNTRVAGVMSSPTLFGLDPSEMVDGSLEMFYQCSDIDFLT